MEGFVSVKSCSPHKRSAGFSLAFREPSEGGAE